MRQNLPVTLQEKTFAAVDRLISTTDVRGKITYCNDAFVEVSGFTREQLIGQPHNLVRHPDMPPEVFGHMWATLKEGRPWMGVIKNRCQNGDFYWVSAYVTPVWARGQIIGFESVRSVPTEAQKQRAERLYARLRAGKPALSQLEILAHALVRTWPMLLVAAFILAAQWLVGGWVMVPVVLFSLLALSVWLQYSNGRRISRTLAQHPKAFTSPLVALTYSDNRGPLALLDMAMISEQARLQTALTRIEHAGEAVRQRAHQSSELARAEAQLLDRQRNETDQSATAISQMASSIQAVAQNVQQTSQAAAEAEQLARQGRELAGASQSAMQELAGSVENIGVAVTELAHSTQSIGSVANVIASIAEQTNLLALNAAIEAARAGEQGRGFAVVADEVRALAARTRDSTEQIHQIVSDLRSAAERAVHTATEGEQISRQSLQRVAEVDAALGGISEAVSQISSMSQQMACSAEEQGQVAEDISQQIVRIAQLCDHSTEQAKEGAVISAELEQMAEHLHSLAERFNR
jgi:aerotaxis receptor